MVARAILPGTSWRAASRCIARPVLRTAAFANVSMQTMPCRSLATRTPFRMSPSLRCAANPCPERPATADSPRQDHEYIPNTPIRVLRTVADVREWHARLEKDCRDPANAGLALVPTMGALHEGHTSLVREAAALGHNQILVSIYVNPAQFGPAEDLDRYPRTWDADCAALAALHPQLERQLLTAPAATATAPTLHLAVFAPTNAELYPSGPPGQAPDAPGSFVTITPLAMRLEGAVRPAFFRGVATVCMKLLHIARPARLLLGQKDAQQAAVLRRMVRDFCIPVAVAVAPTVREPLPAGAAAGGPAGLGLARSSRNAFLGARRRRVAPVLVAALRAAESAYLDRGATAAAVLVPAARAVVLGVLAAQRALPPAEGVLFELDYLSLADPDKMEELAEVDPAKGAVLSGAITMLPVAEAQDGEDLGLDNGPPVRLIDNIILPPRNQVGAPWTCRTGRLTVTSNNN